MWHLLEVDKYGVSTIESQTALRARCLERRRDVVRDKMRAAGLDLLIAYGSGRSHVPGNESSLVPVGVQADGAASGRAAAAGGRADPGHDPALGRFSSAGESDHDGHVVPSDDEHFLATVDEQLRAHGLRADEAALTEAD